MINFQTGIVFVDAVDDAIAPYAIRTIALEFAGQRVLRMPLFTEPTPWERVPGSPAFVEREQMKELQK